MNANWLLQASALAVILSASSAHAVKLSDYQPYEWDVRFTNPVCKDYPYSKPIKSVSGGTLTQKPKNVFCTQTDSAASANRPESPMTKLLSWINDAETKEMFLAYLSWSNSGVTKTLCDNIKSRGLKVTVQLDNTSDMSIVNQLQQCGDASKVMIDTTGHIGGIGYAHNKIIIVNPKSQDKIKIAFSSGNMSSGVVLHHENWNFITTNVKSYFAQAHLCLMDGVLNHKGSKADYTKFMTQCRAAIKSPAESDVREFFAPAEGAAATKYMTNAIAQSNQIWIGAHRFSYNEMINALRARASKKAPKLDLRIVTDDDTYWAGKTKAQYGDIQPNESYNVYTLTQLGAQARYMETNGAGHLLHHSKFLVFDDKAVFCGAGNLTGTGFRENFENYYFITIPSVVQAFRKQYEHVWNDLATKPENMPAEDTLPEGVQ